MWPKYPDAWSEGQSVLTMWALLDDFALGLGDLEKMGLCRQVLRVLFNEKVIVQSRGSDPADRLLEIGLAAREALKKDLLDKTSDFPDDADIVDGHLTDAVRLLVATVLPVVSTGGEAQLLAEIPPLLEALRRTTGWLDHNLGGALPGLRARCGDYVNGGFPDALVLPVGQRAVSAPEGAPVAGGPAPVGAAGPAGDLEELYAAAGRLNVASRAVPSERATENICRGIRASRPPDGGLCIRSARERTASDRPVRVPRIPSASGPPARPVGADSSRREAYDRGGQAQATGPAQVDLVHFLDPEHRNCSDHSGRPFRRTAVLG
ncbi:hypothetical protein GCM10023238_08440 [Streptomyces heliomycini]